MTILYEIFSTLRLTIEFFEAMIPHAAVSLICLLSGAVSSSAGISISGNFTVEGAPCALNVSTDLNFSVLVATGWSDLTIVFDNWIAAPTGSGVPIGFISQPLILRNGVPLPVPFGFNRTLSDNLGFNYNAMTAGDGYIYTLLNQPLVVGDQITLKAGTYTFNGRSGTNPLMPTTFTGNAFLTDGEGVRLSPSVAVPEPGAFALLSGAGMIFAARRKRI